MALLHRWTHHKKPVVAFLIFGLLIFIIIVMGINFSVDSFAKPFIFSNIRDVPAADAVLILGASVYQDGRLTQVLEDRVITALDAYSLGKAPKILVSGDNSTLAYNEVIPVRDFLVAHGVPEEDIFVDFAGFNTYDSAYRARDVFEARSVIIVSQAFHLPRAVYIARKLGLEAVGLSADKRAYFFRNDAREVLATTHSFFKVPMNADPKFLGEKIPLSGSGLKSLPDGFTVEE